jgi:outer membrane receptor protein involved in Fe transport
MRNAQRSESILIFTPSGRRIGFANLFNVPKARSYGAEAQLRWRATQTLDASVAIGLLGTRIVRSGTEITEIEGNEFDRAPHFSAAAAIDWQPLDRLRVSAQVRHHSAYFTDPQNSRETRIGSATIADARAEYRLGKISIFAQVRNLFDTFALIDLGEPDAGEAEDPRTFAVGAEARF